MDDTEKERNEIADTHTQGEVGIGLIPDGPGRWILTLVGPKGLEIRPGDLICIGNALLDELKSPDGTPIPVKFEADKSAMTKKAAKAK